MRYQIVFTDGSFPKQAVTLQAAKILASKTIAIIRNDVTAIVSKRDATGTYRVACWRNAGHPWVTPG